MKHFWMWVLLIVIALVFTANAQAPLVIRSRADLAPAMNQIQADLASLNQHHENYRQAAEKLSAMYSELSKKAAQVAKLAGSLNASSGGSSGNSEAQLMAATQQMQETQMSFNLQYLQLQNQMQNENRQYTAVSNILKAKHDTVKNSINNIR